MASSSACSPEADGREGEQLNMKFFSVSGSYRCALAKPFGRYFTVSALSLSRRKTMCKPCRIMKSRVYSTYDMWTRGRTTLSNKLARKKEYKLE